ncbi:MAG: hypothetical protein ACREBW_05130, partial [Candidatus Micrarchaeaceae archaeon]
MDRRSLLKKTVAGGGALTALHFTGEMLEGNSQRVGEARALNNPWMDRNETEENSSYRKIKAYLDSIPSIDTHEHLRAFDQLSDYVDTDEGHGMNLYGLWRISYLGRINSLTPWRPGEKFEEWWGLAKHDFDNVRATDFYRYMWLAFRDLYNVDFDHITNAQAAELNRRIFKNYRNQKWLYNVIKKRANIELIISDRYWKRLNFRADYPFEFITFNVTALAWGFHPSEYFKEGFDPMGHALIDSPYLWAHQRGIPVNSLDDYLALLDRMFADAKGGDCICLKTTIAYNRTLYFENVTKEKA